MAQDPDIRIGVLVPSGNVVHKREFEQLPQPGVTFQFAGFSYPAIGSADFCGDLEIQMQQPLLDLKAWGAQLILVGCTTASMDCSRVGLGENLEAFIDLPVVTAAGASLAAAAALKAHSVAVTTPYGEANNAIVSSFLEREGLRVAAIDGLGVDSSVEAWKAAAPTLTPDKVLEMACAVDAPDADALYLPCTGMGSLEAMDRFEKQTGKPAFSSVQAGFWASLRRLGVDGRRSGSGRLLETWDF